MDIFFGMVRGVGVKEMEEKAEQIKTPSNYIKALMHRFACMVGSEADTTLVFSSADRPQPGEKQHLQRLVSFDFDRVNF